MKSLQIGMRWGQDGDAGGLDRVYTDFIDSLPAQGVAVAGLVQGPADAWARSAGRVAAFAPASASMPGRLLGARRSIVEALHRRDIDLIACHFALYGAAAIDRLRRHPLVMHFHGPWSGEAAAEGAARPVVLAKRAVERLVYRRAERVIVLSEAFGELIVRQFGVREDRLRLVPGHVDIARFAVAQTRREARLALGLPLDRPILLTVRRLASRMGIDRLLSAMVDVVRAVPDVLLCIGGAGGLRAALERQVEQSGLGSHVRFLGFVAEADLPLVFRAADCNLLPSLALEGFGLVAAEALAAGTPSLVTPVGGLAEVVRPLSPNLVLPSTAPADIARSLIAVLRGELAMPDSEACRDYASRRFPIALAASRVASVYREACG